jgi:hypothetical protein
MSDFICSKNGKCGESADNKPFVDKDIYNAEEVAKILGKSDDWVRDMARSGVIPAKNARHPNANKSNWFFWGFKLNEWFMGTQNSIPVED